jgi:hypothetical protein
LVEKVAQLNRAESAFEKHRIRFRRLGKRHRAQNRTLTGQRIGRTLNGFRDTGVAVILEEGVVHGDAGASKVPAASCDEGCRIAHAGIERGKPIGGI